MRIIILLMLLLLLPSVGFCAPPAPVPARSVSLNLHQVKLADFARVVFGDLLLKNYTFDSEIIKNAEEISVNWNSISLPAVDEMAREIFTSRGFDFVQVGKVLMLGKRKIIEEEKGVLIYKPRYRSARYLSDILAKVADSHQLGSRGLSTSPGFRAAAASVSGQDNEKKGSPLAAFDKSAVDQMAYQCDKKECVRLESLLVDLDTVEAQVVLRAAVYEVGTTSGNGSAVQLAAQLLGGRFGVNFGSVLAGGAGVSVSVGGLDAVLSVLDQDGRFKVVSRPMLRVRTGQQARFSVGQQVPVLGAIALDKNGNSVQSVDYRQSGTIFTVQPDIRRDVIDLDITQELSSFAITTTGVNNSPTLLQRMASSQLSIKPGEVVVFAGLEEQKEDATDSRFFGWSVGDKKSLSTTEVLLFIEAQVI